MINEGDPFAEVCFDVGLICHLFADAFGGLVEDFLQDRRVAAFGDFRAGPGQHVLKELSNLLRLFFIVPRFTFGGDGAMVGASLFNGLPQGEGETDYQRRGDSRAGYENHFVSANQFLEFVKLGRWASDDRLVAQVPLNVGRESVGRLVSAGAVFLQALHHDPVQVAAQLADQSLLFV